MNPRVIVVAWTLLCFTGCTSMQAIKDPSPDRIRGQVEVGDDVRVVATNGKTYDLEVTGVDEDSLSGKAESGKRYRIPYSVIASIEVSQASAGKTGGALAAVALILYAAAIYYVLMLFDVFDSVSGNSSARS